MGKASKKLKEGHEQHDIVEMGGNLMGLLESIAESRDKIIQWKKERGELNANIKAEREKIEAKGVTKLAFDRALAYFESSPEQRDGFDVGYAIAREGMGFPIKEQLNMFDPSISNAEGSTNE